MSSRRLDWDYTACAEAYLRRPQYAENVIHTAVARIGLSSSGKVADIGAGTGKLTVHFLERGIKTDCVEPNAAMRALGVAETAKFGHLVRWIDSTAEKTRLDKGAYALATFGSSFNVVNQQKAMAESARILDPEGWIMCCWNHRDPTDQLQQEIEKIILRHIPSYSKGARAEEQTKAIEKFGYFERPVTFQDSVLRRVSTRDWMIAWRSHITLSRQAGDRFGRIIADIGRATGGKEFIDVPYITKCWLAKRTRSEL